MRQRRIAATFSSSAHWCRRHGRWWAQGTLPHPRTRSFGIQSAGVSSAGRQSGGGFSPPCGRCGCTATRSSSEVVHPPTRKLCTTRGGLLYLGIKEASAPCNMYPCNCALCNIVIKSMTPGDTALGVSLAFFKKKMGLHGAIIRECQLICYWAHLMQFLAWFGLGHKLFKWFLGQGCHLV